METKSPKKERKKVVEEKNMLKSVKQVESVKLVENIKLVAEIKITKLKYFSLILILKLLKNDTTTKT